MVRSSLASCIGTKLLFLPPYGPDLNPIENAFSKLEAMLRKAAARTRDHLWKAIAQIIDTFAPTECANYFAATGHEADCSGNALAVRTKPKN
jgi:transposase